MLNEDVGRIAVELRNIKREHEEWLDAIDAKLNSIDTKIDSMMSNLDIEEMFNAVHDWRLTVDGKIKQFSDWYDKINAKLDFTCWQGEAYDELTKEISFKRVVNNIPEITKIHVPVLEFIKGKEGSQGACKNFVTVKNERVYTVVAGDFTDKICESLYVALKSGVLKIADNFLPIVEVKLPTPKESEPSMPEEPAQPEPTAQLIEPTELGQLPSLIETSAKPITKTSALLIPSENLIPNRIVALLNAQGTMTRAQIQNAMSSITSAPTVDRYLKSLCLSAKIRKELHGKYSAIAT
jgi:hypothetical protein